MPFGDPRPARRRPHPDPSKGGRGRKAITGSPRRSAPTPARQPSTPLKVGLILADCLEVTPRLMSPLQVTTGAREVPEYNLPRLPVVVIDVVNLDDGQQYQIMVTRKQ